MDFLGRLFDTFGFPARWYYGRWSAAHGWLHILSDLGVWSAYWTFLLVLGYLLIRRKDTPFRTLLIIVGACVLLCDSPHLMEAVIFWWPGDRLAGVLKLLTAVVSWATVIALVRAGPTALAMRLPDELEREIVACKQAEQRLWLTLDAASAGAWSWDAEVGDTRWDDRFHACYGFGPDQARTFDVWVASIHPDDRPRVLEAVARVQTTPGDDRWDIEFRSLHARLGVRWHYGLGRCEWNAAGGIQRMFGIDLDITDQKRMEEELRRDRERLAAAQSYAPVGIVETDFDGHYLSVNEEFCRLTGYTPDELRSLRVQDITHPDDILHSLDSFRRLVAKEFPSYRLEKRYVRKDGSTLWATVSRTLLTDATGQPLCILGAVLDITARKEAEQRLQESHALLDTLFATSPVGLSFVDADLRFVRINAHLAAIDGWAVGEYAGKTVADMVPQLWPTIEPLYRRALAGRAVVGVEVEGEVRSAPGERRHFVVSYSPVEADGKVVGVGTVVADDTARKRAEERLAESRQFLRSSIDALSSHIAVLDENGIIITVNEAWRRFADENQFIGQDYGVGANYLKASTEGCGEARLASEGLADVLAGRRAYFEYEYPCHSLTEQRWFVMRVTPFRWAGPVRVVVAHEDVTHRRRAEEAMRVQSERTRLLSEAAALLLATDDPDAMLRGLFAKIGPALGLDAYFNYMVNDNEAGLRLASCVGVPDDVCRAMDRLAFGQEVCGSVASTGKRVHACHVQESDDPQAVGIKAFGLRAYACHPLTSGDTLLGTLGFGSRTRDEFTADEMHFLGAICQYVATAYERLRLLAKLREADRRKDEFLATLAHELRNPLAPVRNAVQVLRLKETAVPELEWAGGVIDRQVQQMTRLIDDLMDVSRIGRGKIELRREEIGLDGVVQGAVEASRPLIDQMGHELTVTLPPHPIIVNADPTRLAQVFMNLLTNAAKYTERGGHIWLAVERQGSDVVVSVRDTGIGIPADKLRAVFDLFSQVEGALSRSQGGLGIGLNIVKRLVEMHGGSIEAKSGGQGKGSEFVVRLPVVVGASGPPKDRRAERAALKSSFCILIVDDNRDGADSLAMMLKIMGNDTRTAYDGEEAVRAVEEYRPDVVLLDIGLPKLNGYEACRRIRQQPGSRGIVVIAQTGWGADDDRQRTHDAGFDYHMVKPVDPQALMKLLAELNVAKG